MAQETAPQGKDGARVERELSPCIVLPADAHLRSWVARDHEGFDESSFPHGDFVDPARLVTQLAVKVTDQPWHPPVLVNGPSTTYTRIQGPWAPAIATRLAPLGAYRLLGPAVSEIGGSLFVALEDIVGAEARRLSEQVQSARTWDERGRLLDDFLLDRSTRGPQPSPEVSHAWHLLVRSGGRSTIRGIARQVGWSHKHLITRFKQQVGVAPTWRPGSCASQRCGGTSTTSRAGPASPLSPATPTRPTSSASSAISPAPPQARSSPADHSMIATR